VNPRPGSKPASPDSGSRSAIPASRASWKSTSHSVPSGAGPASSLTLCSATDSAPGPIASGSRTGSPAMAVVWCSPVWSSHSATAIHRSGSSFARARFVHCFGRRDTSGKDSAGRRSGRSDPRSMSRSLSAPIPSSEMSSRIVVSPPETASVGSLAVVSVGSPPSLASDERGGSVSRVSASVSSVSSSAWTT